MAAPSANICPTHRRFVSFLYYLMKVMNPDIHCDGAVSRNAASSSVARIDQLMASLENEEPLEL